MDLSPRPATVVRIISRLNTGGPAIHSVLLTRGLDPGRFRSLLVTGVVGATEGDMSYYAERQGVVPIVVRELGRRVSLTSDLVAFGRLLALLLRERPAVVHTHAAKAGGLGRAAGVLYNVVAALRGDRRAVLVHTFHGHIFDGYFGRVVSSALVLAERMAARFTDCVVAVSTRIRDDLVYRHRVCGPEKAVVVPLGLDFDWTAEVGNRRGVLRNRYGIGADRTVVGMVGRLTAIKNHRLLLSCLSVMRHTNIAALIVGDGELRSELETLAREDGVAATVSFTGWIRDSATMYADLDIVCLTSNNEGTPVALLEGMAAGLPFVATRVGGVPDLALGEGHRHPAGFTVHANGILVEPNDPAALAAALDHLAARPELRGAMGMVGQAAVLKNFAKERLITDTEDIYARLLGWAVQEEQCGH